MDKYKQSLIRKLKVKSSELKDELCFIQSIYEVSVDGFCVAVSEFCLNNNLTNPLLSLADRKEEKDTEELTPQIKKLFREIAKKTHSDSTGSEDSRPILEDAVKAKKENKSSSILSIANKLKLDTSSLDYKSIDLIEASIKKLEQEIYNITNSYPWLWHHAISSRKNNIIEEFVLSKV